MMAAWNRLEWTGTMTVWADLVSGDSPHSLVAVIWLIDNSDNRDLDDWCSALFTNVIMYVYTEPG